MATPRGSVLSLLGALLALSGCALDDSLLGQAAESSRFAYRKMMRSHRADEPNRETKRAEGQVQDGDALRDAGNLPKAMWHYLQAYRLDPGNSDPKERIAYLHLREDPKRAKEIFDSITKEQPNRPQSFLGLGVARLLTGERQQARVALERAIELDDGIWLAHSTLGIAQDLLGDSDLARGHYRKALELKPSDPGVLQNLGYSLLLSGQYEVAVDVFGDALEREPGDAALLNNLGLALGRLERYEEALAVFRGAGSEQAALNNLGYVASLNGRLELAIEHYEAALLSKGEDTLIVLQNLSDALRLLTLPN